MDTALITATNSTAFINQTMKNTPLYSFEHKQVWARVLSVHDGDTITCVIESFPGLFFRYNVRLDGIDTSEMTSKDTVLKDFAELARNRLIAYITDGAVQLDKNVHYTRNTIIQKLESDVYLVYLACSKMDKYGRILAQVYKNAPAAAALESESANDMLIREGYALPYDGGKKQGRTATP